MNNFDDYYLIDKETELDEIIAGIKNYKKINDSDLLFIETEFIARPEKFIPIIYDFIYALCKQEKNNTHALLDAAIVYYLNNIGSNNFPFSINSDADILNTIHFYRRAIYKQYIHKFYNYYSQIVTTAENYKLIRYTLDTIARYK